MQIILADSMGMCFGVRDALAATTHIDHPTQVTIFGELVHNPVVTQRLAARGFSQISETQRDQFPDSPTVMITAHGISDRTRAALRAAGKKIVDTTCPLVTKAHAAAKRLAADGYFVIVIGKPGHVEVQGLIGDLPAYAVVDSVAAVRQYPEKRLGILCQTTTAPADASAIHAAIIQQNPQAQIRFIDTICQPTRDRQRAMERMLDLVDTVVVVGGRHSNNTRRLVDRSLERGIPAHHVESAPELQPDWFRHTRRLGLTAGTSTLPETISTVHARLQLIAQVVPTPSSACSSVVTPPNHSASPRTLIPEYRSTI